MINLSAARGEQTGARTRLAAPRIHASRDSNFRSDGYILIPVVLMLAVVATLAYLLNIEGALGNTATAREFEAEQVLLIAEAGYSEAKWQLEQTTTCTGYADLPVTTFGAGSYSATVAPTFGSPVSLVAVGSMPGGAQRTLIRGGVKAYPALTTATLQPGGGGEDTFILDEKPLENRGNNIDLITDSEVGGKGPVHTLLRFDLSSIPSSTLIESAEFSLYLYANNGDPDVVEAHRLQRDWVEGVGLANDGANWNTSDGSLAWSGPGGDYDLEIAGSFIASGTGWMNLDLTSLTQNWVDGSQPNYGIALLSTLASGNHEKKYHSSDSVDASLRPKLTLTYACECGVGGTPGTLVLQPGPEGKDSNIDGSSAKVDSSFGQETGILVSESPSRINALLEFDLSGLPPGSQITSAGLDVYLESKQGALSEMLTLHRMTQAWLEGSTAAPSVDGATWSTYDAANSWVDLGGDYVATPAADLATTLTGPYSLDISALVADWANATQPNFGMLLRAGSGLRVARFTSSDSPLASQRPKLTINYICPCGVVCSTPAVTASALLVSTLDDVVSSGAPGLAAWTDGEALTIADPNLAFEPGTTNGTFSSLINIDNFASDSNADIDALHYVGSSITVGGANSVDLVAGDLLISTADNETLTSFNSITVNDEDVFVFRPTTSGDYSSGAFTFLIDGSQIHGERDTVGITLVEKDTSIGNGSADKGTFLIATSGRRDVQVFPAFDVGPGTTTGTVTELIDGASLDFGSDIRGIDLAEDEVTLGGHTIPAGSILLTLNNDDFDGVGDNRVPVNSEDIFYLTVSLVGASPVADATLLFEGLDVNLNGDAEGIQALTISNLSTGVAGGLGPIAHWKFDDGTGTTAIDSEGGHDGALIDGPDWTGGRLGGALEFDGGNDYVDVGNFDVSTGTGLTLMAWFNAKAISTDDGRMISKADGVNAFDTWWQLSTTDVGSARYMRMRVKAGGTTTTLADSTVNLTTARWYFAVATYDNASGDMKLYLDGALIVSGSHAVGGTLDTDASVPVAIGANGTDERFFDGILDDVRVYDRALNATEVSELFAAGGGGGGGGGRGVVYEEFTEAKRGTNGTSLSIAKPAGTAAGDLIIAAVATDGSTKSSLAPPAGWNVIDVDDTSGRVTFGVWWKLAGGSEPANYTFSWSDSERAYGMIMRFTGHDAALPINVSESDGGSSSAPESPAVTTTVSNALILRLGGFDDDDITVDDTGLSGHTDISMDKSDAGSESTSGGAGYVQQPAAGNSGTATFSLTASEEYRAVTIGIAPAP